MPTRLKNRLHHLFVTNTAEPAPYTYPKSVRGPKVNTPARERAEHAAALNKQLESVRAEEEELRALRSAAGVSADRGMYLRFESEPKFELAFPSLDRARDGLELVAVQEQADRTFATVFVPDGKLGALVHLVEQYANEDDPRYGRPKNRTLVESISHIRRAALDAFWTDDPDAFPSEGKSAWWEVWLRGGKDEDRVLEFRQLATAQGLRVEEEEITFVDRTVVLAFGTGEQMSTSVELLDCVAEIRLAKETASFFTERAYEQRQWVDAYRELVMPPPPDAPAVCVLDTGVTRMHPLIGVALAAGDTLTCDPDWGAYDHAGHGTEMAGLALHGDLADALQSSSRIGLEHRLESVKIVAPKGISNDGDIDDVDKRKKLWGSVTREAAGRAEANAPRRPRIYSMAVTTDEGRDRGSPSSWSAEVDQLCLDLVNETTRVFVISGGNVPLDTWVRYPDSNDSDSVHDPAQAWNALTVGAFTERAVVTSPDFAGWTPIALPGTLSPSSTTSLTWKNGWPNKPDIVFEGGNGAQLGSKQVDCPDDLSLLTTYYQPMQKLLVATGDTSAATAQVARMAAILLARYPGRWPETIRALVVHSAVWTGAMREEARRHSLDYLVRRYGYGVPNLERACWSASNALTLVAEDALTPYGKKAGGRVGTKDLNLHTLPWPRQELEHLFDTEVQLRVTLSYYVEPNPARRGWKQRFRYASHGLRFALRNPGESLDEFRARVSKDAQDGEDEEPEFSEPGWLLGRRRNRGSIHSDLWTGSAQDLADRCHLAVFPVGGWWKERPTLNRWRRQVRYSLVVSILTPETGVDIYTPVAVRVGVPVKIGDG